MDDITFYWNMLNLVWFFDNGLWREILVSFYQGERSNIEQLHHAKKPHSSRPTPLDVIESWFQGLEMGLTC